MSHQDEEPLPAGWVDKPIETGQFVITRDDGTVWPIPYTYDKALRVEMYGDGEPGYILGNAHTHRGRFHVCFPESGYSTLASVYELSAVSAEARYWLQGFLVGYEPKISEYIGREPHEDYDETNDEWFRYKDFLKRYYRFGTHPRLNKRPTSALVITDEERDQVHFELGLPWTYVGERVLVPDGFYGANWTEADPQPQMDVPWLAGTACAEREKDDLLWLEQCDWSICRDCGDIEVHEFIKDD